MSTDSNGLFYLVMGNKKNSIKVEVARTSWPYVFEVIQHSLMQAIYREVSAPIALFHDQTLKVRIGDMANDNLDQSFDRVY